MVVDGTATIQNNGGIGVLVDDSSVDISNSTINGNGGAADLLLRFAARATLNGNTIGTTVCDQTDAPVFIRDGVC
jgi:hypothetical protein